MEVNITVKNLQKVMNQLKKLDKRLEPDFQEIVKGGAQLIRGEAIKSIQQGAKSGIVYEKYNPRRTHRASAPGESPASDTGNLVSKIIVKQQSKDKVNVESNANYSAFLEYGTSKKPIVEATFKRVVKKIEEFVK